MLEPSANFTTYNNLLSKKPVWVVTFGSPAETTKFASGTFSDIDSNYKKIGVSLEPISNVLNLLNWSTEYGGHIIKVKENTVGATIGHVLELIVGKLLLGVEVDIKLGFQQLAIADFLSLETEYLDRIKFDPENYEYEFHTKSMLKKIDKPILKSFGKTEVRTAYTAGGATLNVNATASFTAAGANTWGNQTDTYLKVRNELFEYTAIGAGPDFSVTHFAGENINHAIGEEVYEVIITRAHMSFELLMQILTTTAAGTNGDWDLGIANAGLGISIDTIEFNEIRNELDRYGKWADNPGSAPDGTGNLEYFIDPHQDIKSGLGWIEENILQSLPAYFYFSKNGKLSLRVYDIIGDNEGTVTLTTSDIIGVPKTEIIENETITHLELSSEVRPEKSYHQRGNFSSLSIYGERAYSAIEYQCDTGDTTFGERRRLKLNHPSVSVVISDLPNYDTQMAQRYFGRFGNSPVEVKFETFVKNQLIQIGDRINITNARLPVIINATGISAGSYGWTTKCCEVKEVTTKYCAGKTTTEIMGDVLFAHQEAGIQNVHIFQEGDINDTTLTVNADIAANNLQAADAYLDQSTYKATDVMVEFELTLPAAGGGITNGYITVVIHCQNPANTDIGLVLKRIYYDETASGTQKTQLYKLGMASTTFARIKIDWSATSGANPPTAVKVTMIKFWDFKSSITKTTLKSYA